MRPVDKSCIEVSTDWVEESIHADSEKSKIKMSTHWVEESTHVDSKQSGIESVDP